MNTCENQASMLFDGVIYVTFVRNFYDEEFRIANMHRHINRICDILYIIFLHYLLLNEDAGIFWINGRIKMSEIQQQQQDKVISLFRFIEELNKQRQKIILKANAYPWFCEISSVPQDFENIHIFYRDTVEEEVEENSSTALLSVHKPDFYPCPQPLLSFESWLEDGWQDYHQEIFVKKFIGEDPKMNSMENPKMNSMEESDVDSVSEDLWINEDKESFNHSDVEYFEDDATRVEEFHIWQKQRFLWSEKEKLHEKTRNFFTDLYKKSIDLERDSETMELVVANGFIRDRQNKEIDHPVITRRVKIRFEASENTIYIEDTDLGSEFYTQIFQSMQEISLSSIGQLNEDLSYHDYHPLDRNSLPEFLKVFVHQISADSIFSDQGIPENWDNGARILLYLNPCFILRNRIDGTVKAIESIVENVEQTGFVPSPIVDIVQGGKIDVPQDNKEPSIEQQLAAVGGESVDILLSKEANREQLEIARRIESYNAVLVQGPPGTGKTHTIANLMGHLLAHGKSVLVTSQTTKALSVLKEKVVDGLQSLCVSVLDDSNVDMEKSVDGITAYMSQYTSFELKKEMEELGQERNHIIQELAEVRKKLFAMIYRECNCIVWNGESISPSAAAAYVQENEEKLGYIPGKVRMYAPLPLTFSELTELYRSNGMISDSEENELEHDLPDSKSLLSPMDFEIYYGKLLSVKNEIEKTATQNQWEIQNFPDEKKICVKSSLFDITVDYPNIEFVRELSDYINSFSKLEEWMQYCVVDGKNDMYRSRWILLTNQLKNTCEFSEKLALSQFGKKVEMTSQTLELKQAVSELKDKFAQKGKVGKLDLLFNKQLESALNNVTINGQKLQNVQDCNLVLEVMELKEMREQCLIYWNELMAKHGVMTFEKLDEHEPERIAKNYIPSILSYLDWYQNDYTRLVFLVEQTGLSFDAIFEQNLLDSEVEKTRKLLYTVAHTLPVFCKIFLNIQEYVEIDAKIEESQRVLQSGKRSNSDICKQMLQAMQSGDVNTYRESYGKLEHLYEKYDMIHKREEFLERLSPFASQWADAIRKRVGIHGNPIVPEDVEDAWRWKQYYEILDDITKDPFRELQEKSLLLSKEYRNITAKYAEKCAWYQLLKRTESDLDMNQALIGWKQTVKKIGKGTGKNAPMYRAQARKLMVKCQQAVPAWIMPINKALESLDPRKNSFDVVIIDEASQSDISSLAILYMGKKLVIVGDDKQVSPMAIGMEADKMNVLKEMYLGDKIPNAHLYDAKTSIYDIAATTFQPLMLREHFRCVPDIINFSNWLSYDFKIKPLRDVGNSKLLPAVVNYRVSDGWRERKTNPNEAKTIVALMRACMQQPEYANKTFGVISLLGDDQVKMIQAEIYKQIDPKECAKHHILCGNASHFQGDERDVIFLSVVDCANGEGPVSKQGFGVDDAYRKRYNVAVSRAKDQLWVVHSLDSAIDLKPGDIRKMLIDYATNPSSVLIKNEEIEEKADSPFEVEVAKYLTVRGYHLVQQWKVGAYRLDMVAVCGTKKVAIECDGERFHSGEAKIREDMERQTILERLGWRFIRIRGSEYFRNPEDTMQRVIWQLNAMEISPEQKNISADEFQNTDRDMQTMHESELLQRVKVSAYQLMSNQEDNSCEA